MRTLLKVVGALLAIVIVAGVALAVYVQLT